ncbi:TIGR03752 family integrating conjugative element protein [Salmonella enterica subsp. enterica]|nr:TIGR03752 family integrating conjugative element protein [Salmonella enterica subsp. enterica]
MQLKSNALLKILVPTLLLGAGFVGLKACRTDAGGKTEQSDVVADLTGDELKALGIDGDTPRDTVATLVGQMKQYRTEMEEMRSNSAALVRENQRLRERDNSVETRINSAISRERENFSDELQKQQTSMLDKFQSQLNQLSQKPALPGSGAGGDIPPGLGLDNQDTPAGAVRWVEPADAMPVDKRGQAVTSGVQFPSSFGNAGDNPVSQQKKAFLEVAKGERAIEEATPVYTLPENSTLTGSVAMTALLGRVPVNGTVSDPYPFKVLIGRDNLTANGIELPDVEGAIISGTASGDWTLSCVRGTVHSMTFVFRDGTIRTVPSAGNKANNDSNGKSQGSEIGWLSDPHGLPCIPGERKSNAAEYIGSQVLLAGSSAAADAFANGQTTTTVDGGSVTSAVTGSSGQYVLGQALGGGLKESADWFKQRYGQMFDAIYVPPGHPVAVHITRQIPVDYETQGRKVKYATAASHKRTLD